MPSHLQDDGTPVVYFNATLEISPFTLFRRLDQGRAPALVDIRPDPDGRTLTGAVHEPNPEWRPSEGEKEIVLFDGDGSLAVAAAERLQQAGYSGVKALFGGLDLYEFSLDPEVLEVETFLETRT